MKKTLIVLIAIFTITSVNAQMTGGGTEKKKSENTKTKREGKLGFYGIFGYRSAIGDFKDIHNVDKGFGVDFGKQFKLGLSDKIAKEISIGIDLSGGVSFASMSSGDIVLSVLDTTNTPHSINLFQDCSGRFITFGLQFGPYISYNIPNTDAHIDIIYKIGIHYSNYDIHISYNEENSLGGNYYERYYGWKNSWGRGIGIRNSISINIRYNTFFINTGFEFGSKIQISHCGYLGYEYIEEDAYYYENILYESEIDFDNELPNKIPTNMFRFGIGFMF